tara:strand:- start:392 stop:670 length:279 start_codon:yes stop_codon:yes gene_type:complete
MEYYQIYGRETCPYCCRACEALKEKNINFMFCEMEHSPDLIAHYKEKYNMTTVPIVVKKSDENEELIGGCTDLLKHLRKKSKVSDSCSIEDR